MSSLSLWCTFTCLAPPSKSQLHLFVVCFVPFISGPLSVAHSVISLLFTLLQCRPHPGSAFSPPFSFLASPSQSRPHFCIAHLMYLISGSLSAVHLVIFLLVIPSSSPWCVFFFSALSFLVTLSQSHHCLCVVVHVVPDISGSPSAVKLEAILVLWYVFFAFSILATPSKPHLCFCIVCFMPFLSGPPSALCIMHFSALSCCSILSSSLSLEQALFVSP